MKKKVLIIVVATLLSLPFVIPQTTSAFWPFTKGEVKGESTDAKRGFLGLFKTAPIATTAAELTEDAQEDLITTTSLTEALKNKNITEAQATEIKKRLGEIRAEREKLKSLRKSFNEWLVANSIDRKVLVGGRKPTVSKTPSRTVTPKPTRSGQY